ncbi:acyltransferase [Sneathiella marina]|uniref:Acyltransferase n=1 Tax=Sneathiella marina TaxID=2950108 RepID=A0ABY4W1D6_9PROT|nr:acyltransferase [Sneathiella marina]USG60960.1 acyltransferase [Sneathiella marina]
MEPKYISDFAKGRDNNLNLIRMVAAIGVLVSHAWAVSDGLVNEQPFSSLLKGIDLGTVSVYVFFAISGFLIAQSFVRANNLRSFWSARIFRIFPALLVVLLLTAFILAPLLTSAPLYTLLEAIPAYIARNFTLFFLQHNLPGVFMDNPVRNTINIPLWTLNYELICYISVCLLGLAGVLNNRPLTILATIAFLVAYSIVMYFEPHQRLVKLAGLALPFMTGVVFFVWREKIRLRLSIGLGLAAAAVICYPTPIFREAFVIALAYGVFLLAYLPDGLIRHYNQLGDYSYGIYIYAFPIQQITAQQGVTEPLVNIMISLPLALTCAVFSWRLIERPSLSFAKKLR